MNWERFQTYGLSPDKAFEMLCNQLFENWCKGEYKDKLYSFSIVNGAGGDGGVESFAELSDHCIIGLQAKWFRSNMESGQFDQIKKSIQTALKVRPTISRYIVCVPRDLASKTARKNKTETDRWDELVRSMENEFPGVLIELWNDTRILAEAQKPSSAGIYRYWFDNVELDYTKFEYSFQKAKASWLLTKYEPDLNTAGQIHRSLLSFVGDMEAKQILVSTFHRVINHCNQFVQKANRLLDFCKERTKELFDIVTEAKEKVLMLQNESELIAAWLINESIILPCINSEAFNVAFDYFIEKIRDCRLSYAFHFHTSEIDKELNFLSEIDFFSLLRNVEDCREKKSLLFLGNPGTGKTHGVSAFAEYLLKKQLHIPIIVQAKSITDDYNWKDIITHTLGISSDWNENDLWQALVSSANRNKANQVYTKEKVIVLPKVLIIVDGLDESSGIKRWLDRMGEASYISSQYPQIKFCFTSRPASIPSNIGPVKKERLNESGDTPAFKLFDSYIKAYRITVQKSQWLKYALNTPLALKLFCELHAGQTVSVASLAEVSMEQLWRKKIAKIQTEFNSFEGLAEKSQSVFQSIVALSKCFLHQSSIERAALVDSISEHTGEDKRTGEKLLDYLEKYGVVSSFCEKGTGANPDKYIYSVGIHGYIDYASAMNLIEEYKQPSLIDFSNCGFVSNNTLYCLAMIAVQCEKCLITHNETLEGVTDPYTLEELEFYSLQNADFDTAEKYKDQCIELMKKDADSLALITNRLVLPLSRIAHHPLGTTMLNDYLNGFSSPAQRDIVWSLPAYLQHSSEKKWWKSYNAALIEDDEYALTTEDRFEGLPTIYAWMMTNVSNDIRNKCRGELMRWAANVPEEFYKLFISFSENNDPQLKSDLFSILMCLVYISKDTDFISKSSGWIMSNILSPDKIDYHRDISVRYYAIAIVKRAELMGIYTKSEVDDYLPPYNGKNCNIDLNKDALAGTRMGGYSAIDYDLARYVLIDHFDYDFNLFNDRQLDNYIKDHYSDSADYRGMTSEQFILSAAYAYILGKGWNENEFYNNNAANHLIEGVDCSILASYHSADHGARSRVMTVCEKYVWQARNEISGFLCDRLLFGSDKIQVTDYNLLDDFPVPIQFICCDSKKCQQDTLHWYVPELESVSIESEFDSKSGLVDCITNAPSIDWNKWILINNSDTLFSIPDRSLVALWMYACFEGFSGIETCLFMNTILIPTQEIETFVKKMKDEKVMQKASNPSEWVGYVETSCYITPRELSWFPWKRYYDSPLVDEFPDLSIKSAINRCCYSSDENEEVYYSAPAAPLRAALGIVDTDGRLYYDKNGNAVSEFISVGESWGNSQEYVVTGTDNLKILGEKGLSLIWILQELRRETGTARERFGEFYTERRQYYIAYYKDGKLVIEKTGVELQSAKCES